MTDPINPINPEDVAYWFFRLNGCLTTTNFIPHKPDGSGAYTDGDVIAVRFPHRAELDESAQGALEDHDLFQKRAQENRIQFFLVEVKFGDTLPKLNATWLKGQTVLKEFLKSFGLFPSNQIDEVTSQLFDEWRYLDDQFDARIIIVSKHRISPTQHMPLPPNQQITWQEDVLPFIYKRFNSYWQLKRHHPQWDQVGHSLYSLATTESKSKNDFVEAMMERMNAYSRGKKS